MRLAIRRLMAAGAVVLLAATSCGEALAIERARALLVAQADVDEQLWQVIVNSTDPTVFEGFVAKYPDSRHADEARAKIEALTDAGATVAIAPPPAAPAETPKANKTPKTTAPGCVVVKVRATDRDPAGDVWDWRINGNPEPDIIITEATSGLAASCPDSFTCRLSIPDAPATLSLKIIDEDTFSKNELIGEGQCSTRSGCQLQNATVTMGRC